MVVVLGIRGPATYQLVDLPDADVAAATDPVTGWAILYEPDVVVHFEPDAPISADWVVPGYVIPADLYPPVDPPDPPDPEVPVPVAILSISNALVAVVAVAVGDIGKFTSGATVEIAGALAGYSVANGTQVVGTVDAGLGTFELVGIDTSLEVAPATDPGMTATPAAAPAGFSSKSRGYSPPPQQQRKRR